MRQGYVNRAGATPVIHALNDTGLPLCGTRLDWTALEDEEGPSSSIECKRCLRRLGRTG